MFKRRALQLIDALDQNGFHVEATSMRERITHRWSEEDAERFMNGMSHSLDGPQPIAPEPPQSAAPPESGATANAGDGTGTAPPAA